MQQWSIHCNPRSKPCLDCSAATGVRLVENALEQGCEACLGSLLYPMLSGHGESVLLSVIHEGSAAGMVIYCSVIDEWLSVCAAVALAKALCGFNCKLYGQLQCFLQAHVALPSDASGVVRQQLCPLLNENNKMCNRSWSVIAYSPFMCTSTHVTL